jgi:hypothetical protein
MITDKIVQELVEALERCECQFWACPGPFTEPEDMKTCFRCDALWYYQATANEGVVPDDESAPV